MFKWGAFAHLPTKYNEKSTYSSVTSGLAVQCCFFHTLAKCLWTTNTQEQAVAKFGSYFPGGYSTGFFFTLSILATMLSIAMFTRYKAPQQHTFFTSLIIIQAAFLLLFTWQLL